MRRLAAAVETTERDGAPVAPGDPTSPSGPPAHWLALFGDTPPALLDFGAPADRGRETGRTTRPIAAPHSIVAVPPATRPEVATAGVGSAPVGSAVAGHASPLAPSPNEISATGARSPKPRPPFFSATRPALSRQVAAAAGTSPIGGAAVPIERTRPGVARGAGLLRLASIRSLAASTVRVLYGAGRYLDLTVRHFSGAAPELSAIQHNDPGDLSGSQSDGPHQVTHPAVPEWLPASPQWPALPDPAASPVEASVGESAHGYSPVTDQQPPAAGSRALTPSVTQVAAPAFHSTAPAPWPGLPEPAPHPGFADPLADAAHRDRLRQERLEA